MGHIYQNKKKGNFGIIYFTCFFKLSLCFYQECMIGILGIKNTYKLVEGTV